MNKFRLKTAIALLIAAHAHLLVSCDEAGWTGPFLEDQSPAGIYTGALQSTATTPSPNRMVTGVIGADAVVHFMIQDSFSQYAGVVSVVGDKLSGTLTEYLGVQARFFGLDGVRSIVLDGTVSERDRLFGDYSGDDQGFFGLDYSDNYERASSLDQASGIWTFDMASSGGALYNVTLSIDPNGQLFGTDTNGCVFSGELSIIDSRYNAYKVIVSMSSCESIDGEYGGLAYRADPAGSTWLYLFFANGRYAFSTILSQ